MIGVAARRRGGPAHDGALRPRAQNPHLNARVVTTTVDCLLQRVPLQDTAASFAAAPVMW
jgi:hypothetical protein